MADLKTLGVILRNALWGGNLASLKLWRHPQQMADYMRHTLVLFQAYTSTRGLPQKNVFEVLPTRDVEAIRLGSLKRETTLYGEPWFHSLTSYSVDIINLCLICQILRPNIVFEIGTFHGYTALHLALNTPPESRVYTLDLPAGQSPMLGTTWVDNAQVKGHESTIRPTDRPTDLLLCRSA